MKTVVLDVPSPGDWVFELRAKGEAPKRLTFRVTGKSISFPVILGNEVVLIGPS